MDKAYKKLVKGLQSYFKKANIHRAVVGLSGGVDSSVAFKLAVDALGSQNVAALILPELGITKDENIQHAKQLADFFKVKIYYQPINAITVDFSISPWKPDRVAQMNTKARIRGSLLYSYANANNALVIGTSNKSELLLGYGTKYGDLACDIMPLGSLYKTEIYELAEHIGIPEEIIMKAPTAELEENQSDEAELGASYKVLDSLLEMIEDKVREPSIVKAGYPSSLVKRIKKRIDQNAHKREMPPIL